MSDSEDADDSREWEVEAIMNHRVEENGEKFYRVHWKGYDTDDDTWEPEAQLRATCQQMVEDYEEDYQTEQQELRNSKPLKRRKSKRKSDMEVEVGEEEEEEDLQSAVVNQEMHGPNDANGPKDSNDSESQPGEKTQQQEKQFGVEDLADIDDDSDKEYEVEYLVKHRAYNKKKSEQSGLPCERNDGTRALEYYVKWKNWAHDTNTWEHEDRIQSEQLVSNYWSKKKNKKAMKKLNENAKKMRKNARKKVEDTTDTANNGTPEQESNILPDQAVSDDQIEPAKVNQHLLDLPALEPEPEPVKQKRKIRRRTTAIRTMLPVMRTMPSSESPQPESNNQESDNVRTRKRKHKSITDEKGDNDNENENETLVNIDNGLLASAPPKKRPRICNEERSANAGVGDSDYDQLAQKFIDLGSKAILKRILALVKQGNEKREAMQGLYDMLNGSTAEIVNNQH